MPMAAASCRSRRPAPRLRSPAATTGGRWSPRAAIPGRGRSPQATRAVPATAGRGGREPLAPPRPVGARGIRRADPSRRGLGAVGRRSQRPTCIAASPSETTCSLPDLQSRARAALLVDARMEGARETATVDAIVVPASRRVDGLQEALALAEYTRALLVVLCS